MRGDGTSLVDAGLVDDYLAPLYRFAFRLAGSREDAEDLVQETFLMAHQKFHQLRDERTAFAWLLKILRSCRSRQLERKPPVVAIPMEDWIEDPRGTVELDEVDPERLAAVLAALPEEFREPLLLYYFEDFSYKEIADLMNCPIGTVMSRLSRAKACLRNELIPEHCAKDDFHTPRESKPI
ncbi:MAG: sigma-70 family RNA polymerase sigma factor [Planctomycetota bacterium]